MKRLIMVLVFALQTLFASAALAWSPLDSVESAIDRLHCYAIDVSSDESDSASTEEEEEEPDCE